MEEIHSAGYRIVNVDTVLVMMRPKIVPIANELRASVAELLEIKPGEVGIKAKTPEGLEPGRGRGGVCDGAAREPGGGWAGQKMAATADIGEVNEVVESLVVGVRDTSALGRKVPAFDTDDLT